MVFTISLLAIITPMCLHWIRSILIADFDTATVAKAKALATLLVDRGDHVEFQFADEIMPEYSHPRRPEYYEVTLEDGELLERSLSLHGQALPRRAGTALHPKTYDLELQDGRQGRAAGMWVPIDPADDLSGHGSDETTGNPLRRARIVVARSRESLDERLAAIRTTVLIAIALGALVLFALVRQAVAWGLRPLEDFANAVATVDVSSLDHRIEVQQGIRELEPFGRKLNELLGRLEEAFDRERRTTANIAHELRSPIADLRSMTDVALRWPDEPGLSQQTIVDARNVAQEMGEIVECLLELRRFEAQRLAEPNQVIRLADQTKEAWEATSSSADREGFATRFTLDESVEVVSNPTFLRRLLHVLFDNAMHHAAPTRHLEVDLRRRDRHATLSIANPCVGMSAADARMVCEPFWRKDPARAHDGHAGLGLSIAQAIASMLESQLTVVIEDDLFRVTLSLPAHVSSDDPVNSGVTTFETDDTEDSPAHDAGHMSILRPRTTEP